MKWLRILLIALLLAVIAVIALSCTDLLNKQEATPDNADSNPTSLVLTIFAGQPTSPSSTPEPQPAATATYPVAAEVSPSGSPSPTATHTVLPQSNITSTPEQSTLPSSTVPVDPQSHTPTFTPTPVIPNAAIQIADPGPLSRIISPLRLVTTLHTVPSGSYHIELWVEPLQPGGEPRLLLREVTRFVADPFPWILVTEEFDFELSRVSELGELRILTYDRYGRSVSAASVDLILLQYGESLLTPPGDILEPLVILDPAANILIQAGTLSVTGLARPQDDQPLLIELVAADGFVAGVQQVFLTPDPTNRHVPFSVDMPYTVNSTTWVRLIISQSGVRIPGIRMLNSLEILLSP